MSSPSGPDPVHRGLAGPLPGPPRRRRQDRRAIQLLLVALLFTAVGLGLSALLSRTNTADAPADVAVADANPTVGTATAPIVMEVWTDYACPFCQRHATEVEGALLERYVDTGQVRVVWHDFPAHGRPAIDAAVAARAADRQGRFLPYSQLLFANQGAFARTDLLAYAAQLGLDVAAFEVDLDDPFLEQQVLADWRDGQARGIRGTPTFFLNGRAIVGAQPLEVFTRALTLLSDDAAAA